MVSLGLEAVAQVAKALIDTNLAQSANMAFQQLHDPGVLFVRAMLNKDQSLDAARDAIFKALDDVVKNPPSPEEVESARTQLLRGMENSLSDPQALQRKPLLLPSPREIGG